MGVEASIWRTDKDGEGFECDGDIVIECAGDEEVLLHLRVDGSTVATATLDRFTAGLLVGHITAGAVEAVKT